MAKFSLDGLDQVDWAGLEHAYGPATDVPEMLRELADDRPTSSAFRQLFKERASLYFGLQNRALQRRIEKMGNLLAVKRRGQLTGFDRRLQAVDD
jgi:hypothetical protein